MAKTYPEGSVGRLIHDLDGAYAVAHRLGLNTAKTVFNWMASDTIPERYHCAMLQIAMERGVYWRPPGWDVRIQLRVDPQHTIRILPPRGGVSGADMGEDEAEADAHEAA